MATSILKKGSIEMLTLLMLQEGDIYGYQLIQMLSDRSGGKLTVQEGSLYPLRRRNRVLYHLEPSGRVRLSELKAEFDQVQEGIRNVFINSVPIGYEREGVYEQGSVAVSSGSEEENSPFGFRESGIPAPAGG